MPVGKLSFPTLASKVPLAVRLFGVLALVLVWVFGATFIDLVRTWSSKSQYSHGFLVPVFAGYLLWTRRAMLSGANLQPSWWGLPLLLVGLACRFGGVFTFFDWLAAAAIVPCLAGACVLAGGWRLLAWAWPALGFLIFMVPLPFQAEVALSHPLQRVGTTVTTFTLQTIGMSAFAEGNVIVLGEVRIGVVEACSGLAMLMTFIALSTAVVLLMKGSPLEKAIILLSAAPIAIAANVIRIIVTAILHKVAGREIADLVFHDLAGYLMPFLALAMLWCILKLMAWVLQPAADDSLTADTLGFARTGFGPTGGA